MSRLNLFPKDHNFSHFFPSIFLGNVSSFEMFLLEGKFFCSVATHEDRYDVWHYIYRRKKYIITGQRQVTRNLKRNYQQGDIKFKCLDLFSFEPSQHSTNKVANIPHLKWLMTPNAMQDLCNREQIPRVPLYWKFLPKQYPFFPCAGQT